MRIWRGSVLPGSASASTPVAQRRPVRPREAMAAAEVGPALVVAGVDDGAVGKDDAHGVNGPVAVLLDATAHAAGVIGERCRRSWRVDRGRIGADLAIELGKDAVGMPPDDSRLQLDLAGIIKNPAAVPARPQPDQDGIRDGLAGKAGARCPEGDRQLKFTGFPQDTLHLLFAFHVDDDLGDQTVKTGVRAKGYCPERVGD